MNLLQPIFQAAAVASPAADGDYMTNGLLHCGLCRTPKQCVVQFPGGRSMKVPCLCACALRKRNQEQETRRRQEEMDRLERVRSVGIVNQVLRNARFSADDGKNPAMEFVRRYADQWEEMRSKNLGLLLYGACGTGKSFAAACIANALIDSGTGAYMTNTATVLTAMGGNDKAEYLAEVMRYPLLVLDDFGAERNTEYAVEQMFSFIDSRYRSGRPMVITTNIPLHDLRNPVDVGHARLYGRILERVAPVNFGDTDRRKELSKSTLAAATALLRDDP